MDGFFLIDKKKGETSFDVVRRIRKETGEKKVGHSGTLDPLATGLLLVAVGNATKLLEYLIGCDKEYLVKARFGFVSDSYDADGEICEIDKEMTISEENLQKIVTDKFVGKIFQIPPRFSALKIGGRRAYDLAREGKEFQLEKRELIVKEFAIEKFEWPLVVFKIFCGSGTYVRSLVHDLGQELNCGAYVEELRRTRLGNFGEGDVSPKILKIEEAIRDLPRIDLSEEEVMAMKDGKTLKNKKIEQPYVFAYHNEKLLGVVENSKDGIGIKYKKMI